MNCSTFFLLNDKVYYYYDYKYFKDRETDRVQSVLSAIEAIHVLEGERVKSLLAFFVF